MALEEFYILGDSSNFREKTSGINQALEELSESGGVESGIRVALSVLSLITSEALEEPTSVIDSKLIQLPNAERQDHWFNQHPWMRGERAAFELLDSAILPLQAKFYWLQKKSTSLIAGSVHFTKNWEDHDFTRTEEFKVGIDFFLLPDSSSVLVALSNYGKLRVLELTGRLTNTQLEIFQRWHAFNDTEERTALHSALWESFKLQSVNSSFYDGVADAFNELVVHLRNSGRDEEASKLFASRLLGRLIFVWFLRKMGMVSNNFPYFDVEEIDGGEFYRERLERLFFRTLNTPVTQRTKDGSRFIDLETPYLNGGLFSPSDNDWLGDETLSFPVNYFQKLFEHFERFNFTTDESTPEYEQVAIDPEMLGRVFESLLASQVDGTGEQARKAKGAFYTPRELVSHMCREAIRAFLENQNNGDPRIPNAIVKLLDTSDQEWAIAGTNSLRDIKPEIRDGVVALLDGVKVFDPACGSGAFPLAMLQLLTKLRLRLEPNRDPYHLKLSILKRNIFGSDIEPMAVEISRLRSWLSLIVDGGKNDSVEPLPNLEFNFVCANTLIPLEDQDLFTDERLQQTLQDLREEYFSSSDPEKKSVLQAEYLKLTDTSVFDGDMGRTAQLKDFDPFHSNYPSNFFDPEYMFGVRDGFDVVIGNPPYLGEKGHATEFKPVRSSRLGQRFYAGMMDYFYFFFHRGIDLTREDGVLCFITTNYFTTAKYAQKLREDLKRRTSPKLLINFGNHKIFDAALGQHNLITLLSKDSSQSPCRTIVAKDVNKTHLSQATTTDILLGGSNFADTQDIPFSDIFSHDQIRFTNADSHGVEVLLQKMSSATATLSTFFKVSTGAKTRSDRVSAAHAKKFGLDEQEIGKGIFVLSGDELESLRLDSREREIIKPWFKSSDIKKYCAQEQNLEYVIYADKRQRNLEDRPKVMAHLNKYREIIDAASSNSPYIDRPREIDFEGLKIVTPYKTPEARFAMTEGPWYASGDVYYIVQKSGAISLWSLLAILNSNLLDSWFWLRGKRKGNLIEMYADPLNKIPLPAPNPSNSSIYKTLDKLSREIHSIGCNPGDPRFIAMDKEINSVVCSLFRLTEDEVTVLRDEGRAQFTS